MDESEVNEQQNGRDLVTVVLFGAVAFYGLAMVVAAGVLIWFGVPGG